MSEKLDTLFIEMKCIKFDERMTVHFYKNKNDGLEESGKVIFKSDPLMIMNNGEIMPSIELSKEKVLASISRWVSQGSGWIIDHIEGHYLNVYKCNPLEGNSYIPLPEELRHHRKGLVNIQNKDDKCFMWCHAGHENLNVKDSQRITKLDRERVETVFNYRGLGFPVKVKDYHNIEVQNHIKINVFGYENKQFYPIYISKGIEDEDEIDFYYLLQMARRNIMF